MNEFKTMFNGCVLMNDAAIKDEAVISALQSASNDNFEYKSINSTRYYISDRD